jgi:hypothetical protein
MYATYSKTITEADIVLFAGVSGDNNAVHTNEEFAQTTPFRGRIAHGFLTASVISAAVANRLPGPGTVYLGQQSPCAGEAGRHHPRNGECGDHRRGQGAGRAGHHLPRGQHHRD